MPRRSTPAAEGAGERMDGDETPRAPWARGGKRSVSASPAAALESYLQPEGGALRTRRPGDEEESPDGNADAEEHSVVEGLWSAADGRSAPAETAGSEIAEESESNTCVCPSFSARQFADSASRLEARE